MIITLRRCGISNIMMKKNFTSLQFPSMATPLPANHEGVSCDGCSLTAFSGNRYKCLRCSDYDLCFACFTTKNYGDPPEEENIPMHDESHPMQLILSHSDFEQVYQGDPRRRYEDRKIASFTCPYCNVMGFTEREFGSHVTTMHSDPPIFTVICPICIGTTYLEHSQSRDTIDMSAHYLQYHGTVRYRSMESMFPAAEPITTRPAQRRPMLARRTQRAGTARTAAAGRPLTEEEGADGTEIIRSMRPDVADEYRRMVEYLNIAATGGIRNAQRLITGERPTVVVESAMTHRELQVQQVIRPLATISIYPPTSDESGDETPLPAADSADESEDGNEANEFVEDLLITEDEDLKNNEFWKTVKNRISAEDATLILETMKTTARVKEEKDEKISGWSTVPVKPLANAAQVTTTSDSEGDPGWLPLVFETTPIRSTGCGGYWSDKRFLRPRKMQREQSVASSNAEIMEKAEVAMALCRATSVFEPSFSDFTKPDIALKEALQHLNLGDKPEKMREYRAAEELINLPERDPITTGEEEIEMPDFTARGYGQIVDGNVPLGVVPEADEAITNSEDEEGVGESSGEEEDEEQEEDDEDDDDNRSQDSSIPEEINIIS